MDIMEEVAKAIAVAIKGKSLDTDAGALLKSLPEQEQERMRRAARDAIETYLVIVAMPVEVRDELDES